MIPLILSQAGAGSFPETSSAVAKHFPKYSHQTDSSQVFLTILKSMSLRKKGQLLSEIGQRSLFKNKDQEVEEINVYFPLDQNNFCLLQKELLN